MSIAAAFIAPHPPIIIPEVGRGQEKAISRTTDAFTEISQRIREIGPDTVVVVTPHSVMYADYFHISPGKEARGDFRRFGAGKVRVAVDYDCDFAETLEAEAFALGVQAGSLGEKDAALDHGALIPLYFIQQCFTGFKTVRIGLSGLPYADHYRLGECISKTSQMLGRKTVLIASGDLSHKLKDDGPYGYAPEGPEFDKTATEAMAKGDFNAFLSHSPTLADKAAECGLRSFIVMAGAFDSTEVKPELLSYEGPFGVGYAVASFMPLGPSASRSFLAGHLEAERAKLAEIKANEDVYVRLARHAIESKVAAGKKPARPEWLTPELLENKAGVFVSLKKHGELRGCIGTISPVTACVADEILRNAQDSALHDPRFDPVEADELDSLVYSVDVLSHPEPIDSPAELDTSEYGVIVTKGTRRGLLLPNLEGVDTVEDQIAIALRKAGIKPHEGYSLERFKVVRHK